MASDDQRQSPDGGCVDAQRSAARPITLPVSEALDEVLDYATPDDDGLPEFHPEAEALIDAGANPLRLRELFPRTEDAARYYAKSMARRFSVAEQHCEACDAAPAEVVVIVRWQIVFPLRFTEFRWAGNSTPTSTFMTRHGACNACHQRWAGSSRRAGRVMLLGGVTFITSLGAVFYSGGLAALLVLVIAVVGVIVSIMVHSRTVPPRIRCRFADQVSFGGMSSEAFLEGDVVIPPLGDAAGSPRR